MSICSARSDAVRNSLIAVDRGIRRAAVRRQLASLLVALYVLAAHGLPGVHLLWHRSDHVHTLGGLRWLRRELPAHRHADRAPVAAATATGGTPRQSLRPASELALDPVAPHLSGGQAHGQLSFVAPTGPSAGLLASRGVSLAVWLATPAPHDLFAAARARAPPASL